MVNKSSNTPVLDQLFSEVKPISVREFTMKEPSDIADDLIKKHFPSGSYSQLHPWEKDAVKNCILEALSMGAIQTLIAEAKDPLSQEIARDAVSFEETLAPSVDKARVACGAYPWGWRYISEGLQKQFRDFCKSREKKG
jgi:hypothetical protein